MIDYGEFAFLIEPNRLFPSIANDQFLTLVFGLKLKTAWKTFKTEHWFDNKPACDRWMQFFI